MKMRTFVWFTRKLIGLGLLLPMVSFANLPESQRATEALARVDQPLQKQLERRGLALGNAIFIRIFKGSSELEVWLKAESGEFHLFKRYAICHYSVYYVQRKKRGTTRRRKVSILLRPVS